MIKGYDVSHYQGRRHLDGADFIIAKATEGVSYTDPLHGWFRDEAHRIGAVFGSYHFAHPGNSVRAEVDHFLDVARPRDGELVALDLEDTDGRSDAHVAGWAKAWLVEVARRRMCAPLLYVNRSYIEAGRTNGCEAFPLWIADPSADAGDPRHPHWVVWSLHQYSIAGNIDHDVANFDTKADLRRLAVGAPKEDDMAYLDWPEKDRKALANDVADALLHRGAPNPAKLDKDGEQIVQQIETFIRYGPWRSERVESRVIALAKAVNALAATLPAADKQAIQEALKDAVIDVDVHVSGGDVEPDTP